MSDILVLVFICWIFIGTVIQAIVPVLLPYWYSSPMRTFLFAVNIVSGMMFILLCLAIKNVGMKVAGFIVVFIYIVYQVIVNVQWLLQAESSAIDFEF